MSLFKQIVLLTIIIIGSASIWTWLVTQHPYVVAGMGVAFVAWVALKLIRS